MNQEGRHLWVHRGRGVLSSPVRRQAIGAALSLLVYACEREPSGSVSPRAASSASSTDSGDPLLTRSFEDDFARRELGANWRVTGGQWQLRNGELCVRDARNQPVWLARRLPTNARIEFDAITHSSDGDIKVEVWGDGRSGATHASYDNASSYVVIFGGWKNRFHVLARLDEHAPSRREIKLNPASADLSEGTVQAGRRYRFRVERTDGKTVRFGVNDQEILDYADESPLRGVGHDHFGFNDWAVPVCFDNVVITPLPDPD